MEPKVTHGLVTGLAHVHPFPMLVHADTCQICWKGLKPATCPQGQARGSARMTPWPSLNEHLNSAPLEDPLGSREELKAHTYLSKVSPCSKCLI